MPPRRRRGLSFAEVPEPMLVLADRRTLPFLEALPLAEYDLRVLLRSAYLQGLNDAMDVLGKRPDLLRDGSDRSLG